MDTAQALQTLVSAAQVAQGKGAFSLQEAAVVAEAVGVFTANSQQTADQADNTNMTNESVNESAE
jgi:hypothetical protein